MIFISTTCLKGENSKYTKDVFRVLEVYKQHNIKNIELGSVHSFVNDLNKIKRYQKDNDANFIIHSFFPPAKKPFFLNFASKNKNILKKSMETARKSIELCNDLDSNLYSTHAGFSADRYINEDVDGIKISKDEALQISSNSLAELCDYASNYDIRIAVENSQESIGLLHDSGDFNNLFKYVNAKNLGALIDIGHLTVAKIRFGINVNGLVNNVKNKIFEIHINKSVGGIDTHYNIDSPELLNVFDKDILKKAILTLEAKNITSSEILKGKGIIERALA